MNAWQICLKFYYLTIGFAIISAPFPATANNFNIELNSGFSMLGKLNLEKSHKLIGYPNYISLSRAYILENSFYEMPQSYTLGAIAQYSPVSYKAGGVTKRGFHRLFGVRGGWQLQYQDWQINTSIDFYPSSKISVYSALNSELNSELLRILNQTDLYGYGWRVREGASRKINLNLGGQNRVIMVGVAVSFLQEFFFMRQDLAARENLADNSANTYTSSRYGSYSSQMFELCMSIGANF